MTGCTTRLLSPCPTPLPVYLRLLAQLNLIYICKWFPWKMNAYLTWNRGTKATKPKLRHISYRLNSVRNAVQWHILRVWFFEKKNNGVRFTRTSCVHHFEMITLDAGNHLTGNIVSQLDTCRRNRTEVDLNKCNQCTKIQCDWLTDFCVSIQQVTMKGHFNIWLLLSAFVLFQVNNKHDWLLNNKKMNEMKIYWNKADQEGKKTLTHTKKPNLTKQKKKW